MNRYISLIKSILLIVKEVLNITIDGVVNALNMVFTNEEIEQNDDDQFCEYVKTVHPFVMPFGKYKGKPLHLVPKSYLHWMIRDKIYLHHNIPIEEIQIHLP